MTGMEAGSVACQLWGALPIELVFQGDSRARVTQTPYPLQVPQRSSESPEDDLPRNTTEAHVSSHVGVSHYIPIILRVYGCATTQLPGFLVKGITDQ